MSYTSIQDCITGAVRANGGKAFIAAATCDNNQRVRDILEDLAVECGCSREVAARLPSTELSKLYAVSRKNLAAAPSLGASLEQQYSGKAHSGGNPLLDDEPAPPREPTPLPGLPVPAIDMAALIEAARGAGAGAGEAAAIDRLNEALGDIEAKLADMALQAARQVQPVNLIVTLPENVVADLGVVHFRTELLIRALSYGSNVYLYGPAGSGKTTAGQKAAEAFKLQFYFTGKIDSEYLLLGFKDARGETVRTPFREAYEHGGLFLFDEIDRSDPGAFTALNAALANKMCSFPDGIVQMHKAFKCIAAGNTRMSGADETYSAGQQQDGASVDRFVFIDWPYDERLETAISPNKEWCDYVQRARKACADRGISHLITPRASIEGGKWINAGETWGETAAACLWKGLHPDTIAQIEGVI